MNIAAILEKLRPGEKWELHGFSYDGLIWHDDTDKPDEKELEAAWPEVERDLLLDEIRIERNALLRESDWTQLHDSPVDIEAWAKYRQELRDMPQTVDNPANFDWPVPPS